MKKIFLIFSFLVFVFGAFFLFDLKIIQNEKSVVLPVINQSPVQLETPAIDGNPEVIFPIAEFNQRITRKPFGIYITPENSPMRPEQFTGYHTGVDVEYEDIDGQVPAYSIADGEIVLDRWVAGYGGTIVLKCNLEGRKVYVLYGHLDRQSFTKNNIVKKGERIANLGKGNSLETDGERKHLHFAIRKNSLDLRGYVENKQELDDWLDPQIFF